MLASREPAQPLLGLGAVGRLAEHPSFHEDVGVDAEHHRVVRLARRLEPADRLEPRVLEHERFGVVALGQLVDIGIDDLELQSEPAQDLPAAR